VRRAGRSSGVALAVVFVAGAFGAGQTRARAAEPAAPPVGALTMDEAVRIALDRNRDVIAARLDIEAAQLDVVAARIYPNPIATYSVGNLVINGNKQGGMVEPQFFSQPVQTIGVSEIIDVWAKRGARTRAAERGVEERRLQVEDALREIVYAVRSAFADVTREQHERQLAREIADRYSDTVRVSRGRFRAGDISEAELRRVELEGLRYTNAVIDADLQLDLAREKLARLMGLASGAQLPVQVVDLSDTRRAYSVPALISLAMEHRPDVRAAGAARLTAEAQLDSAKREVYPDISLGAAYTHSAFTVSGDNPDTLGLSLSLPLPLFDRNQAAIGRSSLDIRRADNDLERLRLLIAHDVAEAVRRAERSRALLDVFEGTVEETTDSPTTTPTPTPTGGGDRAGAKAMPPSPPLPPEKRGMLARSENALRVAEKSYQAGAISLLELLDAQRTYLDVRGQYLRAVYDYRQAAVDVNHAVGTEVK
jgi:cobalt-zinc-cadmium efflux system outer membrane protein